MSLFFFFFFFVFTSLFFSRFVASIVIPL